MADDGDFVAGPQALDAARSGGSAALGAAIGVVAGPAGVVVGAAIGAALPNAISAVQVWVASRRDRILEVSAEAVGGDKELAAVLEDRPDLIPLLLRSTDAAARSTWDMHVNALALALRDGVAGQRSTAETERLLAALIPMTPDGVAVLDYMLTHDPNVDGHSHYVDTTMASDLGMTRSRVRVALRRLEEGGAAATIGGLLDGGEGWLPTDVSGEVIGFLRST